MSSVALSRRSLRRQLAVAVLALAAVLVALPVGAVVPGSPLSAPDVAAASGLTVTADARYLVDPAKRRVFVAVGLSATNHRKDTKTRRFFYDRTYLAVQPGTSGFRISSSGARPTVRVQKRTKTYTLLRIDFGKRLPAGATRKLNLSFDLVDPGGAPTRTTRIGTSLVSFGAWGFGSEGTSGGTVTVTFPAGFSVDVQAAGLSGPTKDSAGNTVFHTGRLANPLKFFAYFVADRPGAFKETTFQVPIADRSIPVTLRAWPDDPAWAKRVTGLLKRGLPALAKDIGLPWTVDQPLIVEESLSRSASGFAGRFDPPAGRIEIAYYATPFVVLHEAAHAWFDGGLLADRWASEGFASWYALRAATAIGEKKVTGDKLTADLEKVRVALNAWGAPGEADPQVEEAEYAASLKLAALLAERATPEGLTAVWQAIHERRAAYQPSGPQAALETADAAPDWRGLLDLFEERTGAAYDDLWGAWVTRPGEEDLLAARAETRASYRAVIDRAGTWRLPRIVRDSLRVWQYEQADELLVGANRALDRRDEVRAAAKAAGLATPDTMRLVFEGPAGFAGVSAEADAELAAIATYQSAAATKPVSESALQAIGLWNSTPDASLDQAAEAFATGDLRGTVAAAAFARTTWETSGDIGRNRVLAVTASVAAVLLALWLLFRWLRDRGGRGRRLHRTVANRGPVGEG
jgi:hypothetical protein